ncbi:MAG TPA: hypothetical protein VKY45_13065 [Marinilabiliaceae bacterium]|nr:hypothetical protein [Marinilabiliaceae bacterium]
MDTQIKVGDTVIILRDNSVRYTVTELHQNKIDIGGSESFRTVVVAKIVDDLGNSTTRDVEKLKKVE